MEKITDRLDENRESEQSNDFETVEQLLVEVAAQNRIARVMKANDKPVFVLVASTNISRIVSVYKSSASSGRDMLVTCAQAKKLEDAGRNVPRPRAFDRVKVYYPRPLNKEDFKTFINMKCKSLGIADVAELPTFTMLVQTSTLGYIKKLAASREGGLDGSTLICAVSDDFAQSERCAAFLSAVEELGVDVIRV